MIPIFPGGAILQVETKTYSFSFLENSRLLLELFPLHFHFLLEVSVYLSQFK